MALPGKKQPALSIIIPTYRREEVLLNAIGDLLPLMEKAGFGSELIIVDQTEKHDGNTERKLLEFDRAGKIRWICLDKPHIARSMNTGVRNAEGDIVLFLDDDIEPSPKLLAKHVELYKKRPSAWAGAGQVLQPWDNPERVSYAPRGGTLNRYLDFPFYSIEGTFIENAMAGNLSVRRQRFIQLGGFDENFTPPVASRFETEFAKRLVRRGGKIWFEPEASIRHLRVSTGGTRSLGSHLTSISPVYGAGDYYYAFRCARGMERLKYILKRPFREIRTKFHLKHPWYIPVKLIGEFRALSGSIGMSAKQPVFMEAKQD